MLGPVALFYLRRCAICQRQREMALGLSDRGKPVIVCSFCGGIQWELTTRFLKGC